MGREYQCPTTRAFVLLTDWSSPKVAIAFIATAWTTTIIAGLNAFHPTIDSISRSQHWYGQSNVSTAGRTSLKARNADKPLEKFRDLALLSLCDIQLVTGTAIVIAGFVQWPRIAFYHRSLVINYWYLTLNSLWAARASSYLTVKKHSTKSR